MKRIFRFKIVIMLILLIPFVVANGQDKKSEQKIKVIVDDGSGKKVIIDTVYKDTPAPDSIKLKDGSTVYIEHIGDGDESKHHRGEEHVFITHSGDNKNHSDNIKEITVISSDSLQFKESGDSDKVFFYSTSDEHREGKDGGRYKVITRRSGPRGDRGDVVYIRKDKSSESENGKTYNVYVSNDDNDSDMDQTRLVIAKDGMVVTIEGNDEAKAKELAKVIEQKLGVNSDNKDKKEITKTETRTETKTETKKATKK